MNYIVDYIGTVVTKMQTDAKLIAALTAAIPSLDDNGYMAGMPFYLYGHRVEIGNRLKEKDLQAAYKYKKYPLVALRLDTAEKNDRGVIDYTLNIALIMQTDENWNAEERYANVFKPVLYPMYESFLKQLKNVGLFMWDSGQDRPKHTKIDRPFWGIEGKEGNEGNIFDDPLDAIEIINLEITQNYKC